MKTKFLVPPMIVLSLLAVPAFAQVYGPSPDADHQMCATNPDGSLQITGDQMTDYSQRGNVIRTGSFVAPKQDFVAACSREIARYDAEENARSYYGR